MSEIYRFSSVKELDEAIDPSQPVFLDTETSKLGSQIRLIQVYQEHWEQVLLFENKPLVWIVLQPHHLILHNGIYDFGCFKTDLHDGAFKMPEHWDDTFYLSRLAFPAWNTGKGYSLDNGLTQVMGYDPYSRAGLNKKELQMSFERIQVKGEYVEGPEGLRELTPTQLLYGSLDVYHLPKLWHKVKHKTDEKVYQLDIAVVGTIMNDKKGMPVDLNKLSEIEHKDIQNIAAIKQRIGNLNVNSYMQVRKALGTIISSDEIALQIIAHRPEGLTDHWFRIKRGPNGWAKGVQKGIDENTITVISKSYGKSSPISHSSQLPSSPKILVYACETQYQHSEATVQLALDINATRKSLKRLNFVKRAHAAIKDGRIQAHFSPHAINGRIQQDNENLTQYPRAMKSMWGHPPGNGRKLLYCDFAQIELRIICAILPEMNMYKALKEGKDLHSFVAEQFAFTPEEAAMLPAGQNPRQVAKQSNFLMLYGGGEANFQQVVCRNSGVWFSNEATHKIVTKWREIFSDITAWHKQNSKKRNKVDSTVLGRKYAAKTVTDLNNIKVSGTGSEVFKQWLIYVDKYILDEDTFIVNRVHDSVTIDIADDPDQYKHQAELLAKLAQKAWFEVIANAPLTDVPMPTDALVGSNMGDIESGKADYSFTLDPYYMMERSIKDEMGSSLQ